MNALTPTISLSLKEQARKAWPDWGFLKRLEQAAFDEMISYDEEYGHYLVGHIARTSKNFEKFLVHKGHDTDVARILGFATRFHDIEKLMQPVSIHIITEEKPSEDILEKRKDHVLSQNFVLSRLITGLNTRPLKEDIKILNIAEYFRKFHHERLNGSGPYKMMGEQMDETLKIFTIVDEVDGKAKLEKHTFDTIFDDILGRRDKFRGQFDCALALQYQAFCHQNGLYSGEDLKKVRSPEPAHFIL